MKAFLALILLALAGLAVLLLIQRPASSPAERPAGSTAAPGRARPVAELDLAGRPNETAREAIVSGTRSLDGIGAPAHPACTLEGSIRDALGDPAASAWIRLKDDLGGERKTEADDAGHFSVSGLHPGRWWAYAGARDHERTVAVLDLDLARPVVWRDFVLQPDGHLRVKIRAQDLTGAPWWSTLETFNPALGLIDLMAVATRERPDPLGPGRTALDPRYGFGSYQDLRGKDEADVLGMLVLDELPPLFVSVVLGDVVIDTLPLEPGADDLLFVVPPERFLDGLSSVRWRLADARSGEILRPSRCSVVHGRVTIPRLEPDEDGWFLLERMAPRTIQIRSRVKGYASLEREVKLEPGLTDLGSIPLEPEVWIRGRVVDPDGTPITVLLEVTRADRLDRHVPGAPLVQTTGGELMLDGLERAEYVLRTSDTKPWSVDPSKSLPEARGMSRSVVVSTLDGPVDGFVLQLETPSTLVLVVEDLGCIGWHFRILEPSRLALRRGAFYQLGPTSVRLPPGPYTLELLSPEGRKLREQPIALSESPLQIRIRR